MLPRNKIILQLLLLIAFLIALLPTAQQVAATTCTPTVAFVAENNAPATYSLADGYDGWIVKRFVYTGTTTGTASVVLEYIESTTITLDESDNSRFGHLAQLWQTTALQTAPQFAKDGMFALGIIAEGATVDLTLIDSPNSDTAIVDDNGATVATALAAMVQSVSFVAPSTGSYTVQSDDSIGIVAVCNSNQTAPTPTRTGWSTVTLTPLHPIATPTPMVTPTPDPGIGGSIQITSAYCDDWNKGIVVEYHIDGNASHAVQILEDSVIADEYTRSNADGFNYVLHQAPKASRVKVILIGPRNIIETTLDMAYCQDIAIFVPLVNQPMQSSGEVQQWR